MSNSVSSVISVLLERRGWKKPSREEAPLVYTHTFHFLLIPFLSPVRHAPVLAAEPLSEVRTRLPAPPSLARTGSTAVLFPALSLLSPQLQNHQVTRLSPVTNSNVNCCPGARWSLSLPCIQHSLVFNYFCSLSLIFLSLLGDKQAPAPSPSPALRSSHHPTIIFPPHPTTETKAAPRAALAVPCLWVQTRVRPPLA